MKAIKSYALRSDLSKLLKIAEPVPENKEALKKIILDIDEKYVKLHAEKAAQDIEIKRLRDLCKPLLRAKSADNGRIITAKEFLEGIDFRPKTARSLRRSPRLSPKKHQTVVEKTDSTRSKNSPVKRKRMETVSEVPVKKKRMETVSEVPSKNRNLQKPRNVTQPRWR